MKLRLNLLRGDGSHNLQITTDATATVGDVAAALASAGPSEAGQAIDPATVSINIIDTAGGGGARGGRGAHAPPAPQRECGCLRLRPSP